LTGLLVVTPPGPDSDTLCANLKDRGFVVSTAGNGGDAVEIARRRQPDVILMDPALSAMDRWHAVKRLNTDPGTSAIPVLTLASDAGSPAGLQRVLAKIEQTLGMDGPRSTPPPVLGGQPPKRKKTRAKVAGVKTEPPAVKRTAPPPSSTTSEPAAIRVGGKGGKRRRKRSEEGRILVVDDNALNRDMLSRRLSRRGYDVTVAEDGQQALDAINDDKFDLILLDWMMPGLSGIDVLKKIREDYTAVQLPVIMATAKTEAEDIVEALRLEANDYVTKPLNFDVVNARMRTQLGLVQAHRDLIASERRYRALLENTGDMIVQFRVDGQILYVSPASRTLLGYEPEAFQQHPLFHWIHPIDRRELENQQKERPTLPPAYTFIARMQRRDQNFIWVETSCRVTRDADGQAVIMAACRDVTEHMERIGGDEPPLPLGGDIMDHPGWRGGQSQVPVSTDTAAAPPVAGLSAGGPPAVNTGPSPVIVLTMLDGLQADLLNAENADIRDLVAREVGEKLLAALKEQDA